LVYSFCAQYSKKHSSENCKKYAPKGFKNKRVKEREEKRHRGYEKEIYANNMIDRYDYKESYSSTKAEWDAGVVDFLCVFLHANILHIKIKR
jgi:hypothetical protein